MPKFDLPLYAEPTGIPAIAFCAEESCKVPPGNFAVIDSCNRLVCDGLVERQAINVCQLANQALPYHFVHLEGDLAGRLLAVNVAYAEKAFAGDAATDAFRRLFAAFKRMLEEDLPGLPKKTDAKDFETPNGFDRNEMTLDQYARYKRLVDRLVFQYIVDHGQPREEFKVALRAGIEFALAYAFRNIIK